MWVMLQVKNLGGDTHLGGQDFDWHIMALALQVRVASRPGTSGIDMELRHLYEVYLHLRAETTWMLLPGLTSCLR